MNNLTGSDFTRIMIRFVKDSFRCIMSLDIKNEEVYGGIWEDEKSTIDEERSRFIEGLSDLFFSCKAGQNNSNGRKIITRSSSKTIV